MILGTGFDLVDIQRIEKAVNKYGTHFIDKILSPQEQHLLQERKISSSSIMIQFIAGRFAGKEAAAKALRTGFTQGVSFQDIHILSTANHAPCLTFSKKTLEVANQLGVGRSHISLTHEKNMAGAFVVLETDR